MEVNRRATVAGIIATVALIMHLEEEELPQEAAVSRRDLVL